MGFALNASTMGMAVGALLVGAASDKIDRRMGILVSLALLSLPTALLATASNLPVFTLLRILQGLCMSSAFALTLAHLGEQCSMADSGGAFAAYITGNVGSNLVGRLIAATATEMFGLATNFYLFAVLNLAGAVLVYFTIQQVEQISGDKVTTRALLAALGAHLRDPGLRAAFICGFCILFAFIGTFTYVNFVLVRPPLSLDMMQVGFVYLVFHLRHRNRNGTPRHRTAFEQAQGRPQSTLAPRKRLVAKPFLRMASLTNAPTPGECRRPLTVTKFTLRQNSGSTTGRAMTFGCFTAFSGMKAKPNPAATIARVQSSRSLQYAGVHVTPFAFRM